MMYFYRNRFHEEQLSVEDYQAGSQELGVYQATNAQITELTTSFDVHEKTYLFDFDNEEVTPEVAGDWPD